jgi:hypothetical protein
MPIWKYGRKKKKKKESSNVERKADKLAGEGSVAGKLKKRRKKMDEMMKEIEK